MFNATDVTFFFQAPPAGCCAEGAGPGVRRRGCMVGVSSRVPSRTVTVQQHIVRLLAILSQAVRFLPAELQCCDHILNFY